MSSGNVNLLVPDDERGRTESLIAEICNDIRDLLLTKNRAYGNSALNPIRIFSKADAKEQILVRIDDKLNRIKQGNDILDKDADVIQALLGYLILLIVWQQNSRCSSEIPNLRVLDSSNGKIDVRLPLKDQVLESFFLDN